MIIVEQAPGYNTLPAGSIIPFVIFEDTGTLTFEGAKVICNIYVSDFENMSNILYTGTFKASPNASGRVIFDFGNIIENVVKPTYSGMNSSNPSAISTIQGNFYNDMGNYHPIHNIDRYAYSDNSILYVSFDFQVEYIGGGVWDGSAPANQMGVAPFYAGSSNLLVFNGVLNDQDVLTYPTTTLPSYGYDLYDYIIKKDGDFRVGGFITDAPKVQYATINCYGTMAFFNDLEQSTNSFQVADAGTEDTIAYITVQPRTSEDVAIGSPITIENEQINGGYSKNGNDIPNYIGSKTKMIFAGLYPANLRGWSGDFQNAVTNIDTNDFTYYSIDCHANNNDVIGEQYKVYIIKECLYPPVRIAWLNKWGAWDYYTFMKKSTRQLKTKRKTYTKLKGTWNSNTFNVNAQAGGSKNYLITTDETIKVNTDYITEEEAQWLEQLFNSNEMYIINPYFTFSQGNVVNKFSTPVNLTDSSYKKKTKINDKLIQYSFTFKTANNRKSQRP
tara:strand:- start:2322 stop:3824 length:1503 start_codon:yes stop_codon:yes gene_type:complete